MFLETIKAVDGVVQHLRYHQQRVDRTRLTCKDFPSFELDVLVNPPSQGIYRCRVLYGSDLPQVSYHPYLLRLPRSFKLVASDTIDYAFKYFDRHALEALETQKGEADTVLIVKKGMISDTPIANVAFLKKGRWYTPDSPLLEGTTRSRLIEENFLHVTRITPEDLHRYDGMAVMNALTGFVEIQNGIMAIKK